MPVSQVCYPRLLQKLPPWPGNLGLFIPTVSCLPKVLVTWQLADLWDQRSGGLGRGVLVWEVIKADRHADVAREADVNAEVDQPLSLGP